MLFRCKVSYLKTIQSAKASKPLNATIRVFRRNESMNPKGPVFLEIQTSDSTRTFKINDETCKLICPPQQGKDKLTIQFKDTTFILLSALTAADRNDFMFLIRSLISDRKLAEADAARLQRLSRTSAGATASLSKENRVLRLNGWNSAVNYLRKERNFPQSVTNLTISDRNFRLVSRLFVLENLTHLSLEGIDLDTERDAEILTRLQSFTSLKVLNLSNNSIQELPMEVWKAIPISLTRLELNTNRFSELPIEMMRLRRLETLNVANNQINRVHESAHKLLHLRHLDLSHNELRMLPASLFYGRKFSYLNLAGNRQLTNYGNTLKFPVRSNVPMEVPTLWQSSLAVVLNISERAVCLLPVYLRIQWSYHVHPCVFCHRLTSTNELYYGTFDSRLFAVDYVTSNNFGRDLINVDGHLCLKCSKSIRYL